MKQMSGCSMLYNVPLRVLDFMRCCFETAERIVGKGKEGGLFVFPKVSLSKCLTAFL